MVDTYTKVVLTVIGGALCGLVWQNATRDAHAQFGRECGSSSISPCYVEVGNDLDVRVTNEIDARVTNEVEVTSSDLFGLSVRVENWP